MKKKLSELIINNLITRRSFIIMSGQLGILSLLASKMIHMQLVDGTKYRILADQNRINLLMLPPIRGEIKDRNGKIIATNIGAFRAILNKSETNNYKTSITNLCNILNIDDDFKNELLNIAKKITKKQPGPLLENLSWSQVTKIEENINMLQGIYIDQGQYRQYPYGASLVHPVGYLANISKNDKLDIPVARNLNFQIGKIGIEKYYEENLQGVFGTQEVEVNAHGILVREISKNPSISGQNMQLNIDAEMQSFITNLLDPRGSSVVLLDTKTSHIISMASTPGFDPNKFVGGISYKYWQQITNDQYKPLINKTIQNQYPPGSIFKILIALAALEHGLDPEYKVNCTGQPTLGDKHFRCWYHPGHGSIKLSEAIEHSCNTYMFYIAKNIGIAKIVEVASKFGLGLPTGIDLPYEAAGFIPNAEWKKQKLAQEWKMSDTLNTAIGQGFTLATPLQLALIANIVANDGIYHEPRIFGTGAQKIIDIKQEHINFLKETMNNVINAPGGTAYSRRIDHPNWNFAGKTGTSQVRSKTGNIDLNNVTKWEQRNHALFIGFAPIENPLYALSVVVDHGGGGSSGAAPIAREIFLKLMQQHI